jgi:hypothetical protein
VIDEVIIEAHDRPSIKEYGLSPFEDYNRRGDIVALSTFASSDIRLKDNIKPIENALSKVNQISPIEFNWKSNGKQDFGVSAQQIEELYPDLVTENIEGYKVVKYNPLIALLLKSIQELHKEVQELKNKIES